MISNDVLIAKPVELGKMTSFLFCQTLTNKFGPFALGIYAFFCCYTQFFDKRVLSNTTTVSYTALFNKPMFFFLLGALCEIDRNLI